MERLTIRHSPWRNVLVDSNLTDAVTAQLEKILSRPPLFSSPRLSRLLRFLVEEKLAGRSQQLNEYQIGLRVFDRPPTFNPRADPIVRVQTHHLRARLAEYYAAEGAADPVVIELPSRTYGPQFRHVAPLVPAAQPPDSTAKPRLAARGPLVTGASVLLVILALLAIMGHFRQPRPLHDPDPVAQNLYARGRYLLDRQTEAALRQGVECFQQAVARDPHFAAAYAGEADAYNLLVQYGFMQPGEGMERARRAAHQALSADSHLAAAYVSLAAISEAYDWNFREAENLYRRAIELDPELPSAHLWYGMFLRDQGRLREALPELRRAEQLEPLSVLTNLNVADGFRAAGDLDSALELALRAEELEPGLPVTELFLATTYRARMDNTDADASLERAASLSEGNPQAMADLACAYAKLGRRPQSAAIFQEIRQLAVERYVSPYDLGRVASRLGDEEHAVKWFEEAYRQHSTGILWLRGEKNEAIQHSPHLQALLQGIGNG